MPPRAFTLNSGFQIPAVGFGTWLSKADEVEGAVETALRSGYRYIDACSCDQNEIGVGKGWKKSGVPRDQIFISSKLWNTGYVDVQHAVRQSLSNLQTDYLDLYLIHWPVNFSESTGHTLESRIAETRITETWAALEELVQGGLVRSIGTSNIPPETTRKLLNMCKIKPAVKQIEAHPYLLQQEEFSLLKENDILPVAFSPLGNNLDKLPRVVDDPTVLDIAKKLNKDPEQLLVAWGIQRGSAVLTKSVIPSCVQNNFPDFVIPEAEFAALNHLKKEQRYHNPYGWENSYF